MESKKSISKEAKELVSKRKSEKIEILYNRAVEGIIKAVEKFSHIMIEEDTNDFDHFEESIKCILKDTFNNISKYQKMNEIEIQNEDNYIGESFSTIKNIIASKEYQLFDCIRKLVALDSVKNISNPSDEIKDYDISNIRDIENEIYSQYHNTPDVLLTKEYYKARAEITKLFVERMMLTDHYIRLEDIPLATNINNEKFYIIVEPIGYSTLCTKIESFAIEFQFSKDTYERGYLSSGLNRIFKMLHDTYKIDVLSYGHFKVLKNFKTEEKINILCVIATCNFANGMSNSPIIQCVYDNTDTKKLSAIMFLNRDNKQITDMYTVEQ